MIHFGDWKVEKLLYGVRIKDNFNTLNHCETNDIKSTRIPQPECLYKRKKALGVCKSCVSLKKFESRDLQISDRKIQNVSWGYCHISFINCFTTDNAVVILACIKLQTVCFCHKFTTFSLWLQTNGWQHGSNWQLLATVTSLARMVAYHPERHRTATCRRALRHVFKIRSRFHSASRRMPLMNY